MILTINDLTIYIKNCITIISSLCYEYIYKWDCGFYAIRIFENLQQIPTGKREICMTCWKIQQEHQVIKFSLENYVNGDRYREILLGNEEYLNRSIVSIENFEKSSLKTLKVQ